MPKEHIVFTACDIYMLVHAVETFVKVPIYFCQIENFTVWTFSWEFCYIKKVKSGYPAGISVVANETGIKHQAYNQTVKEHLCSQ